MKVKKQGPKMEFDKRFIDLGKIKRGDKRSFSYTFTNRGDEDLVISIISHCDCTQTNQDDLVDRAFKPGESAVLEVVFDSTEKEASETIDIDIYLDRDDPKTGGPVHEMVQYKYEFIQ